MYRVTHRLRKKIMLLRTHVNLVTINAAYYQLCLAWLSYDVLGRYSLLVHIVLIFHLVS